MAMQIRKHSPNTFLKTKLIHKHHISASRGDLANFNQNKFVRHHSISLPRNRLARNQCFSTAANSQRHTNFQFSTLASDSLGLGRENIGLGNSEDFLTHTGLLTSPGRQTCQCLIYLMIFSQGKTKEDNANLMILAEAAVSLRIEKRKNLISYYLWVPLCYSFYIYNYVLRLLANVD